MKRLRVNRDVMWCMSVYTHSLFHVSFSDKNKTIKNGRLLNLRCRSLLECISEKRRTGPLNLSVFQWLLHFSSVCLPVCLPVSPSHTSFHFLFVNLHSNIPIMHRGQQICPVIPASSHVSMSNFYLRWHSLADSLIDRGADRKRCHVCAASLSSLISPSSPWQHATPYICFTRCRAKASVKQLQVKDSESDRTVAAAAAVHSTFKHTLLIRSPVTCSSFRLWLALLD